MYERHNGKGTRLYSVWESMKKRCNNKNSKSYRFYGGKGISVCHDWNLSFISFREWANLNGYDDTLSIDRIDSDWDYEPSNCQWIPMVDNIKRSTEKRRKPVEQWTKDGEYIATFESVTKASKEIGIPKSNIFSCLSGAYKSAGGYKWILKEIQK